MTKQLPDRLTDKEVGELVEENRAKYQSFGEDLQFFLIVDGKDLYKHDQSYIILQRDFRKSKL